MAGEGSLLDDRDLLLDSWYCGASGRELRLDGYEMIFVNIA